MVPGARQRRLVGGLIDQEVELGPGLSIDAALLDVLGHAHDREPGPVAEHGRSCCPIGFWFFQNVFTSVSLTMATRPVDVASLG